MRVSIHGVVRRTALLALSVTMIASCKEPTSFDRNGVVVERLHDQQAFRLVNKTNEPLGFLAFDRDLLALLLYSLCADPTPECLRLPARGSVLVPFSEIHGMNGEVVFIVWRVVRQGDGTYEPLMVSTIIATP